MVLDDCGDHIVLFSSFKLELCIYIYTFWAKVLRTLMSWNHIIKLVTGL